MIGISPEGGLWKPPNFTRLSLRVGAPGFRCSFGGALIGAGLPDCRKRIQPIKILVITTYLKIFVLGVGIFFNNIILKIKT
jgi:hypothetical protein